MTTAADWDALEARARAGVPEHRLGWFQSMIRQGREAEQQGRAVLAARCRERVEAELSVFAAVPSASDSPAAPAASGTPAAFAALAARREGALRAGILALLDRHADRLSVAERDAVREALRDAGEAQLGALRRRLVERLLRAARYRRRAALFRGWKAATPRGEDGNLPEGPYNDYRTLEETLRRVASAHPEWVAEFFDIYAEMRETERKYYER